MDVILVPLVGAVLGAIGGVLLYSVYSSDDDQTSTLSPMIVPGGSGIVWGASF